MKGNILVFCAHSDDHILGPGGSIAYYSGQGFNVYTYIFSYGEGSHPHLRKEIITKTRVEEAQKADKIVRGHGVHFFGVTDGDFKKSIEKKKIILVLKKIIKEKKPLKIFTHSIDDAHPDHREVNKAVLEAVDGVRTKANVFVFDLWNPISFKYRNYPRIAIDIRETFSKKIKALKCFKSQRIALFMLLWSVYLRAFVWGVRHFKGLAEVFYRIR